jgi:hypothetical protein
MRGIDKAKAIAAFASQNFKLRGSKRALARKLQLSEATTRRAVAKGAIDPPRAILTAEWRSDVLKSIQHFQATKRLPPPHRSSHALKPVCRGVILPAHVHYRLTQLYKRRSGNPPVPDLRTLQRFFKQHLGRVVIQKLPPPPPEKRAALLDKLRQRKLKKKQS